MRESTIHHKNKGDKRDRQIDWSLFQINSLNVARHSDGCYFFVSHWAAVLARSTIFSILFESNKRNVSCFHAIIQNAFQRNCGKSKWIERKINHKLKQCVNRICEKFCSVYAFSMRKIISLSHFNVHVHVCALLQDSLHDRQKWEKASVHRRTNRMLCIWSDAPATISSFIHI